MIHLEGNGQQISVVGYWSMRHETDLECEKSSIFVSKEFTTNKRRAVVFNLTYDQGGRSASSNLSLLLALWKARVEQNWLEMCDQGPRVGTSGGLLHRSPVHSNQDSSVTCCPTSNCGLSNWTGLESPKF